LKKIEDFKREMEKKSLENVRKIKEREENAIKLCKAKIQVFLKRKLGFFSIISIF